jgi:hypothetical protein
MTNNIGFLLIFNFGISSYFNAQPIRNTPVKKWNLEAFRFNASYCNYAPRLTDFTTVQKLAARTADLTSLPDFNVYRRSETSRQGNIGNILLQASVVYSPRNWKDASLINRRRMVQFGLSFQNMSTYETAYSLNSIVDSVTMRTSDYFVNARQNLLQAESAYLFTTDPDRAVYLYGGAGFNLGFSISSVMEENTSVTITNSVTGKTTYTTRLKDIKTKPYFNWSFVVPFGFHARIYKNWGALADFRYNLIVINNFGEMTDDKNKFTLENRIVRPLLQLGLGIKYTIGTFPEKKEVDESEI